MLLLITKQDGCPDSNPLLEMAGKCHECSLTERGQGGYPDGIRVEPVFLTRYVGPEVAGHVGVHVTKTVKCT